ncbi:MAG: exodeoxyribonuclease VII small subunit [Lachnospiraceae bacterium]|nr:exodeoxyribonuclease VII small subunit [Lachnospiraceae bacterium]
MKQEQESRERELSVEEAFAQLEETVSALEDPEISLEDAFARYQEGMELLKYCNASIDKVEKSVQAISEEGELYEF